MAPEGAANFTHTTPLAIEANSANSQFFIVFKDDEAVNGGDLVFLSREQFPSLSPGKIYLCDLLNEKIYSDDFRRCFRVKEFFENGTPQVSSVSLLLREFAENFTGEEIEHEIEVPIQALKQRDSRWVILDLALWETVEDSPSENDEMQ